MEEQVVRNELLGSVASQEAHAAPCIPFRIAPTAEIALVSSTPAQAAQKLSLLVANANATSTATKVAFLNMHNYVTVTHDENALHAFMDMDYVYPDGVALQIARRITRRGRFRRVSGTDTVPLLLAMLPPGARVYLLGGTPSLSTRLNRRFLRIFPHLKLAGCHHGFFANSEDSRVIADINAAAPHVLLVGMGTPRQETWISSNHHDLRTPLAVCVGGLFHYWAGDLRRAPAIVRSIGLEWLWIMIHQPYKWRIYSIGTLRFVLRILYLYY